MGGSDEPDIYEAIADIPHAAKLFFLNHFQQFGLHIGINVADFVEEDRAAMRHFEQPRFGVDRASESALLVAEQLGLQEVAIEPGAIEVHK